MTAATASAEEGRFRLVFELPDATFSASEAITGVATFSLTEGVAADLSGSGSGLLGFQFDEVDGSRDVGGAWQDDCARYRLEADRPIVSPIVKSVAWDMDDPQAPFYASFARDPLVHLPPGQWDITAVAAFIDAPGCAAPEQRLRATIRVVVTP